MEHRIAKSVIFGLIAAVVTLMTGISLGLGDALLTFVIAAPAYYFLYPLVEKALSWLESMRKNRKQQR